jgi:DNA-binding HxlR family transcriptional regulator
LSEEQKEALEDAGLITSTTVDYEKYKQVEWKLTERGEELLKGGK